MKTIADIRHENLLKLIDECGSVTKFAAATGKSYAQISQLKNRSLNSTGKGKPRSVGDDLAREFEKIAGKPIGWMDTPIYGVSWFVRNLSISILLICVNRSKSTSKINKNLLL